MARKQNQEVIYGTLQKNVIESYIMANSRQNLSIYSERLLLRLVEIAQSQVFGLDFKGGSGLVRVDPSSLGTIVEMNIADLMSEKDSTNYTVVKKSVLELMQVKHQHEEPIFSNNKPVLDKDGKQMYRFEAHQLVNDVYVNAKPGTIIVEVNRHTWAALLDFSKGFRRYDLLLAMKLSRAYSLRLYKLISEQKNPISFTIQELREKFDLGEKYKLTGSIMRMLETARLELDKYCSPWTFTVEPKYSASAEQNKGRAGRKSITSVVLHPVHRLKYEATNSRALDVSPTFMLGKEIVDKLVKYFNFSMAEVKANLPLFAECNKRFGKDEHDSGPDLYSFLVEIAPKANRATNIQGYVINALKIHLKERYHLLFLKGKIVQEEPDLFGALANSFKPDYK